MLLAFQASGIIISDILNRLSASDGILILLFKGWSSFSEVSVVSNAVYLAPQASFFINFSRRFLRKKNGTSSRCHFFPNELVVWARNLITVTVL